MFWNWFSRVVGKFRAFTVIALSGLAACVSPIAGGSDSHEAGSDAQAIAHLRPQIQLELPESLEHWRAPLEADLLVLESLYAEQSERWPLAKNDAPLRLAVLPDIPRAQAFLTQLGLPDDPRVARTYPNLRMAVVPMPRDDRLLRQRELPLMTWRATLCHEAAHLLSLDRPLLREAPLWFQEGYAESWSEAFVEIDAASPYAASNVFGLLTAWATPWQVSYSSQSALLWLSEQPAETRLSGWVYLVAEACARDFSHQPWHSVSESMPLLPDAPALRLFGRDASSEILQTVVCEQLRETEKGCLASLPLEIVALNLRRPWQGIEPLDLQLQLGRSGSPEAGILLKSGAHQIRLRMNVFGQWIAFVENDGELRQDRMPRNKEHSGIGLALRFVFTQQDGLLRVTCDGQREQLLELPPEFGPPFEIQVFVRDGALNFSSTTIQPDS